MLNAIVAPNLQQHTKMGSRLSLTPGNITKIDAPVVEMIKARFKPFLTDVYLRTTPESRKAVRSANAKKSEF